MAWVNTPATTGQQGLVNKYVAGSQNGWNLFLLNGRVRAWYFVSGTRNVWDGADGLDGGLIADGRWHHIALVVDSSGGRIYVDGVLRQLRAWTGAFGATTTTQEVRLGSYPSGNSGFAGSIFLDDVSIWNVNLSLSQIQTSRNGGLTGLEAANRLGFYQCNESSGATVADSAPLSGNNNGTWVGLALFDPILPSAQTSPASNVSATQATLNGIVNPNRSTITAGFQWGATTNYGNVSIGSPTGGPSATVDVGYSVIVTGLTSFTTYHFRAFVSNSSSAVFGPAQAFQTLGLSVATLPASPLPRNSATLNGQANPGTTESSGWFEFGLTTNYGNATSPQALGSGNGNIGFSHTISNLLVETPYHFRAVGSNSFGILYGADQSFAVSSHPTAFTSTGDINLITGAENFPLVTQSETAIWGHGKIIVVAFNDSRGRTNTNLSFGAVSVSTNAGVSFTRLPYLFNVGRECYGGPSVFYSVRAAKWYVGFLIGVGGALWTSSDGINWDNGALMASGSNLDRFSTWVDNHLGSPFYGRQYAAFNNFGVAGGAVQLTYSANDGASWSAPITIHPSFRRAIKVTGSLGVDGTVFVQMLDEGGGGLNGLRANFIARSTNGGVSWLTVQQGPEFLGPGRSVNGYFACMYTNPVAGYWREMGWGQPGVGQDGVVHYAYSARTTSPADPGNIYYVRSADNGTTWSSPIQLNTDTTTRAQWSPSLAVNARGLVFVSWYDERNTTNDSLERFGRASFDNGATWETDVAISDVVFPKPLQVDPGVQSTYAGTYNFAVFSDDGYGDVAYNAWTDGRVSISNTPQQDVFFDKVFFGSPLRIDSISRNGGGEILLQGRGFPNFAHTIQSSINLGAGSFTNHGSVTPDGLGRWQYNVGASPLSQRFYRLAYP